MASITAHVAVLLLLALAGMVEAQLNCAEAPTEALQIQCEQIQKWDTSIREAAEKQANAPKLPPGFDTGSLVGSGMGLDIVPTNLQHCVDLSCACNYLQGTLSGDTCNLASGGVFKKIVRKEYRVMTDEERGRFHGVLNALQATQDFKDLQKIHSQTGSSGSAHSGPAFLPWHREYIKRLEFIIRRQDPTLFLPYWDSTLDTALPKPADSIMFTDNFLGTTDADGNIVTGPFAEWRTLNTNKQVRRKVGAQGAPFTNENIQSVLQQTAIEQVLAFTAPQAGCSFKPNWNVLEYTHGNVHIFIGGGLIFGWRALWVTVGLGGGARIMLRVSLW